MWGTVIALVAMIYISGLFIDLTGDSGLYSAIARQMVESGDWLTLKVNGELYEQKPHLIFWLAGLGIQLFGNSNFAFKIFPFLAGLSSIYFTWRLAALIYSKEAGKWAAFVLATTQIFYLYFFDIHTDTLLQACVAFSLWQLAAWLKYKSNIHFVLGFFGIGLAMMTKGPVGALLPAFALLYYLLMKKDYSQLLSLKWILGVLIIGITISPTLVFLYQSFGWQGIQFYFITNNFGRISGEYAGSSSDPFFYLHTFFWAFLPWTAFVVAAIFSALKNWSGDTKENAWDGYLFGSVTVLLIILSTAKGKAPNYFLIAVPPLAVLTGGWLHKVFVVYSKLPKLVYYSQIIIIVLTSALFLFVFDVYLTGNFWLPLTLIIIAATVFILSFSIKMHKMKQVILFSVIISAVLNICINVLVLPHLFRYQGARQVLQIFERQKQPGRKVV